MGDAHGCALRTDGSVRCWGANFFGQLGVKDGGPGVVLVKGLPPVTRLAAAVGATCALTANGAVFCWGRGTVLGVDGKVFRAPESFAPQQVTGVVGAASFAMSEHRGCALLNDGRMLCWEGAKRQVVDGITGAAQVSVNYKQSCARAADGAVSCFEDLGSPPTKVDGIAGAESIATSPGGTASCAVHSGGRISCWPGTWIARDFGASPDGDGPFELPGIDDAHQLAVGDDHMCLVTKVGNVKCWGDNDFGQLGRGERSFMTFSPPADVADVAGVTSIAAGHRQTCVVVGTGAVRCWGRGHAGVLGGKHRVVWSQPQRVAGVTDAVALALGSESTCALHKSGATRCWGVGSTSTTINARHTQRAHEAVAINTQWKSIWAGRNNVLGGLGSGGHEYLNGQRSIDAAGKSYERAAVKGLPVLTRWLEGFRNDLALTKKGDLISFERAAFVFERTVKPTTVMTGLISADLATNVGCVVRRNGETACFEPRKVSAGKLDPAALIAVKGHAPAKLVRASGSTAAVLHTDGSVSVFSALSSFGPRPRRVADVSDATDIALGDLGNRGCAVLGSGALRCWGRQLELRVFSRVMTSNALDESDIPSEQFASITDAQHVAFGATHACVLHKNGEVSCWGSNANDQVGAVTPPFSAAPITIQDL